MFDVPLTFNIENEDEDEDEDDSPLPIHLQSSIFHLRPFVVFAVNDSQMVPQIRFALSRGFVS